MKTNERKSPSVVPARRSPQTLLAVLTHTFLSGNFFCCSENTAKSNMEEVGKKCRDSFVKKEQIEKKTETEVNKAN